MVVPWSGFPLRKLLDLVQPKAEAKYAWFLSADIESLTDLVLSPDYPWPYQEGLTIEEAANDLTFLATGFYGEPLFKQNGAPVRLIVPWKYGYKSAKSLVRIEFINQPPTTFWNTVLPDEYSFVANVNPDVPHPRWSQKTEWMIDTKEKHPTRIYNGYGQWVEDLYPGKKS